MSSHCGRKLSASVIDRGSASMRFTCRSSTAGWLRRPALARRSSSSSGMVFQRKNDSFDASSRSVMV